MMKAAKRKPSMKSAKWQATAAADAADLFEIGAEWDGAPMSDAARSRCVWPEGKAGELPGPLKMTAAQWMICRRWETTIAGLVETGLPLIDTIKAAMAGPTDAEQWNAARPLPKAKRVRK